MSEPHDESNVIAVDEPRDGLPDVVDTPAALHDAIQRLAAGSGPVAVDAERASGFKYSQRAYLIQLRRHGSGTFLIDPIAFDSLTELQVALNGVDWILHAATQDLICLREVGLVPSAQLFDTELAGRLLGRPKVGLATLLEEELSVRLAKEHSAADWSTRPLPESWLNYAALDVEFLLELWEAMRTHLDNENKLEWALQEFEYVQHNTHAPLRVEPWRRTSGLHAIKKPRELAIVRELWNARNEIAAEVDIAPGRLIPDSSIIALAAREYTSDTVVEMLPEVSARGAKRHKSIWVSAVQRALALPSDQHPAPKIPSTGPPAPRNWPLRNPKAFARLEFARAYISELATSLSLPPENLISPDIVRRMMWEPPLPENFTQVLSDYKVRMWQQDLIVPLLIEATQQDEAT